MTKKILLATGFAILTAACNKKEEGIITTQSSETTNPQTTETTTVTPVDSTTVVKETSIVKTADKTTTTKTTTGEVTTYVSNDGKTTFSVIYDANKGTAAVKNESSGKSYDMKSVVSGSGAKYADKDGYYFWEHHGDFYFGKGDKDLITGKKK